MKFYFYLRNLLTKKQNKKNTQTKANQNPQKEQNKIESLLLVFLLMEQFYGKQNKIKQKIKLLENG